MSDEERRDSLADQAAAWVPPWERPPAPTTAPAQAEAAPAEVETVPAGVESAPAEMEAAPAEVESPSAGVEKASAEAETAPAEPGTAFAEAADPAEPSVAADTTVAIGSSETPEPAVSAEAATPAVATEADEGRVTTGADEGRVTTGADEGPVPAGAAGRGVPRREPVGRRRAAVVPEPAPDLPDAELRGALEAILLVVDEPVSELVLAQVLEQPAERIGPMLDDIAAGYTAAGYGFELRRAAGGWRLYTRPEYATYVERFVLDGQSVRLTQAALETLAVVAYKQPVTRSRISAIRGVNCDGVIRTLVTRGLVEECGTESDSGAFLYRTTTLFLEKLGLNTVDELPPLAPFLPDDVEELADATR
ncbi:SMC-Scp complex subunit ScpB [Micromonospora sp. NPDC049102]|uniref:SMC-Scp complex subunit ScpB n=1 Tax=Micromonospora sp. NPDC049102 TaxID=3364265 RepID=UPI00371D0E92